MKCRVPAIRNGQYFAHFEREEYVNPGEMILARCDNGYMLRDDSAEERTCTINGRFTGEEAVCVQVVTTKSTSTTTVDYHEEGKLTPL